MVISKDLLCKFKVLLVFMKNKHPLITIIIATLNCADTLERCLGNAATQTYPHKELIIIDGGSTDGSVDILKAKGQTVAFWESEPDRGIYHAWNKALKHVDGSWICFLGASDYFCDNQVLANLAQHLEKAAVVGTRVVYGEVAKVDSQGKIIKVTGKPWNKIRWQIRHGMPFIHSGMMHHRSLFELHGLFDESFLIAGDYEFLLRELLEGEALFAKGIRTLSHEAGGLSDSQKMPMLREIARARRMHELTTFSWVWTYVYIRSWFAEHYKRFCQKGKVKNRIT